jgi:hypothetical protein
VSSGAPGTVLGGAFAPDSQAALACALPVLPAAGALAVDAPAALDALAAGAGVAVLAGGSDDPPHAAAASAAARTSGTAARTGRRTRRVFHPVRQVAVTATGG